MQKRNHEGALHNPWIEEHASAAGKAEVKESAGEDDSVHVRQLAKKQKTDHQPSGESQEAGYGLLRSAAAAQYIKAQLLVDLSCKTCFCNMNVFKGIRCTVTKRQLPKPEDLGLKDSA